MQTPTVLTYGGSVTDATSYNTSSVSPSSNKIVLVCVASNDLSGGPDVPTVSGNSMTWTQVSTRQHGATTRRVTIFRGVSSSPSSGAITITFATTQADCYWAVIQFHDLRISGTNGSDSVVQSAGNDATTSTSLTVTLSAFENQRNQSFGFMYLNDQFGVSITPGSGFTELVNYVSAHSIHAEWKGSSDTTVDWSNSTSKDMVGVAIELRPSKYGGFFIQNFI